MSNIEKCNCGCHTTEKDMINITACCNKKSVKINKLMTKRKQTNKSMSKTEETNKLSAEEYYVENCFWQRIDKAFVIELMESYAQLRVEQAKKEWENEIKELKQEIYFLNNSSNFQ